VIEISLSKDHMDGGASVWCLYHVHHHNPLRHRDNIGRIRIGKRDDCKWIGVFATADDARNAAESIVNESGFSAEPDCFLILCVPLNVDFLPRGFPRKYRS
jgi:hypothetical protein